MNDQEQSGLIKISFEEATSEHVDDLLRRQMSMRGDPGVTRGQQRRWYYQNWFVFLIVGALAAFGAWACLEPLFSDYPYLQGTIEKMGSEGSIEKQYHVHKSEFEYPVEEVGWIQIKGQKVWLLASTVLIRGDGRRAELDPDTLAVGHNVGVYTRFFPLNGDDLALAEYLVEDPPPQSPGRAALTLFQIHNRAGIAHVLFFPLVAAFVGLAIGGVDGLICRLPRRALVCGIVGLFVGFIGGFLSSILANLIYAPISSLALHQTTHGHMNSMGLLIQMLGRSIAWAMAGLAMGLGQGIALRSQRLLIYGLIGGVVGGLFGGLFFDPIDIFFRNGHTPDAYMSRLIGFTVVGGSVGALIGVVELLARDAWMRMTRGPLAGKEFLLFKDVMNIGSSPRSDIYLFNDPLVAPDHAVLRAVGDECEIEARHEQQRIQLNGRPLRQARLRHGDQVTIGNTVFTYQKRKG